MSIFFSQLSTWGRQINQTGKYYFGYHFALSCRPDTLNLNQSCSWLLYNGHQIGYNNKFLLLLFADDILVILSALCSPGSQFVHLRLLTVLLSSSGVYCHLSSGKSSVQKLLLFLSHHLLFFLLFNCLAKTLHGSKNSK